MDVASWPEQAIEVLRFDVAASTLNGVSLGSPVDELRVFGRPIYTPLAPDELDFRHCGLSVKLRDDQQSWYGFSCYLNPIETVRGPDWKPVAVEVIAPNGETIPLPSNLDIVTGKFPQLQNGCDVGHDLLLVYECEPLFVEISTENRQPCSLWAYISGKAI